MMSSKNIGSFNNGSLNKKHELNRRRTEPRTAVQVREDDELERDSVNTYDDDEFETLSKSHFSASKQSKQGSKNTKKKSESK